MSRTQVQLWYKRFEENLEDVNDIEAEKKINLDNRRISIKGAANDVQISFGSCQAILVDILGMKRATAKIVSKFLNFEQKCSSLRIC